MNRRNIYVLKVTTERNTPVQAVFEVFTAVIAKNIFVCDVRLCNLVVLIQRFGGTYCLGLQNRGISRARSQKDAGDKQSGPRIENQVLIEARGKLGDQMRPGPFPVRSPIQLRSSDPRYSQAFINICTFVRSYVR
jgi:hypothetical protein